MYCREKQFIQQSPKPKKSHRNTPSFSSSLLDEICRSIDDKPHPQTATFSKVDKWMENDKTVFRRRSRSENAVFPANDPLLYTSTSAGISAADVEFYANRPKPVRTGRSSDREKDCYLFDDYEEHERNRDHITKSKSRAMKIYSNLKKMKQPISPGARLTSFISSIFSGLKPKKSRHVDRNNRTAAPLPSPSPAKMMLRCSTKCADKMGGVIEKNARFDLARVTADREAMPRGQKSTLGNGRPPLPPNAFRNRTKFDFVKAHYDGEDEDENEDAVSESSSDLFELDHLSIFGSFVEELPVYETTYFDKNCRLFR